MYTNGCHVETQPTMSNPSLSSSPSTSLRKNDRLLSVISESMSSKTTKHGASRRARSKTSLMPAQKRKPSQLIRPLILAICDQLTRLIPGPRCRVRNLISYFLGHATRSRSRSL